MNLVGSTRWRRATQLGVTITGLTVAAVVTAAVLLPAVPPVLASSWPTKTFKDPVHGFTFSYPANWLLIPGTGGSSVTIVNPATHTTISPLVTGQRATPAQVLAHAAPAGATRVHNRTLSGRPARDFTMPFVPGRLSNGRGATRDRVQARTVLTALANQQGATDVYTLLLSQPTDAAGRVSQGAQADNGTFDRVVSSFTIAATTTPTPYPRVTKPAVPPPPTLGGPNMCAAVCWADANWNYNIYTDTANGRDCPDAYTNCVAEVQAPTEGLYQPDFQCAEYVARALTQSGQVPGLLTGGQQGLGGVGGGTGVGGSYSYGSYPFTATPYSSTTRYLLVNVGTDVYTGLYHYLINSGLGVNLHQNVSAAQPGDVVFFYSGTPSESNREHVMLITATLNDGWTAMGTNGWDALLDGHNTDRYHRLLSVAASPTFQFEVVHLRALYNDSGTARVSGAGWANTTDAYGQAISWVATTNATSATAQAQFTAPTNRAWCAVAVYVPANDATATVSYSVTLATGATAQRTVNQANIAGWALLYRWGELGAVPVGVAVGNSNGTTNQDLGVGQMAFIC